MAHTVTLVVAVADNGVIGRGGGLPWQLSTDLRRFKADTMGKPIIMGRKTFDTIGKPLPGRHNIVITRNPDCKIEGVTIARSFEEALRIANRDAAEEVCVIGGGQIFEAALPLADYLRVTHVLAEIEGDTCFPAIKPDQWREISAIEIPAGEKDSHKTRYSVYQRIDRDTEPASH